MDNKEYHEAVSNLKAAILDSNLDASERADLLKRLNSISIFGTTAYERGYKNGMKYAKKQ